MPSGWKSWFGQRQIHCLPRGSGHGKHDINYHHIIDSLVRKPGAFENYRYRRSFFPPATLHWPTISSENRMGSEPIKNI